MNKSKIIFIGAFFLITISLFFVVHRKKIEAPIVVGNELTGENKEIVPETKKDSAASEKKEKPVEIDKKTSVDTKLPNKILIAVPFTSQAPFGKWDEYHEETCEEASLLMVQYFLQKKKLTKEIAEKELQDMVAYQIKHYGDYMDSTAEQMVRLAADFYGIKNLRVVYDFSKEELKKELAKGNPVIIPAAGRLLGNPNFTAPGPLYHALVLVGYDGNIIIANDPGTRRGEGYRYDIDILFNAIHDFAGDKNKIEIGRKAMIVVEEEN